jgi:hypothetical protein
MFNLTKTSSRSGRFAIRSFCAIIVGVFFCNSEPAHAVDTRISNAAPLSADRELRFKEPLIISRGEQSSVALHSAGLVVSVFRGRNPDGSLGPIQYRIGKIAGSNVAWGAIQSTASFGYWPAVAISKEGYVIIVSGDKATKKGAELSYQVGWINPNGDERQIISMKTGFLPWDEGHNAGIAMNDSGVIVGVHETAKKTGDNIYYRVGHLRNPAGGDYTIQWESGEWGIYYDAGSNPRIAINNQNEIVSVHQVPGENLLHYRRGMVSGGAIQFTESWRYDDYAIDPSVALLDSGLVLEVHGNGHEEWYGQRRLISRTGNLSLSNPAEIEWADPYENPIAEWDSPAIATNGRYAIETHTFFREYDNGYQELTIDYSIAIFPQELADRTLVKGSNPDVYAVLNHYRHAIPDGATFEAMGFQWKTILPLSDGDLNAIPEGAPFRSVAQY